MLFVMLDLCRLIWRMFTDLFRSRATLEAEILVLRQQMDARRTGPRRPPFISIDRVILGGVCRLFPKMYDALAIVRRDTVIRWRYVPVSDRIGAGNRDAAAADQRYRWKFAG